MPAFPGTEHWTGLEVGMPTTVSARPAGGKRGYLVTTCNSCCHLNDYY
jgi:hypothetical protein